MWTEAGLSMTATPPSATAALTTSCVSGRRYCLGRKLGRCLSRPTPESMVCTSIGTRVCTYNCSILALNCSLLSAHVCVCVSFPGDTVELVEYESNAAGLIRSFTERFQDDAEQLEADLLEMNRRDSPCWC